MTALHYRSVLVIRFIRGVESLSWGDRRSDRQRNGINVILNHGAIGKRDVVCQLHVIGSSGNSGGASDRARSRVEAQTCWQVISRLECVRGSFRKASWYDFLHVCIAHDAIDKGRICNRNRNRVIELERLPISGCNGGNNRYIPSSRCGWRTGDLSGGRVQRQSGRQIGSRVADLCSGRYGLGDGTRVGVAHRANRRDCLERQGNERINCELLARFVHQASGVHLARCQFWIDGIGGFR